MSICAICRKGHPGGRKVDKELCGQPVGSSIWKDPPAPTWHKMSLHEQHRKAKGIARSKGISAWNEGCPAKD